MNKSKLYLLVAVLSAFGYAWLGWTTFESRHHAAPETICLFKEATGIPCPSCGTTRSVEELMEGHVSTAFFVNPFGFIVAGMLLVFPFWVMIDVIRSSDSFFRFYHLTENFFSRHRWISVPAVLIVLANWGWNIMKGL